MNAYMQEKPNVAHVSATQLVNDKKFSKEWKKQQHQQENHHQLQQQHQQQQQRRLSTQPHVTPAVQQQMQQERINVLPENNVVNRSITTQQSSQPLHDEHEVTPLPSTTAADVAPSMDFESQSNPGVEVTLDLFELKSASSKLPKTPSEVSGAPSWTSVQLRSVRSENSEAVQKSKTPNFAKVQLRKVDRPTESSKPDLTVETEDQTTVATTLCNEEKVAVSENPKLEASSPQTIKPPVVNAPLVPPQVHRQTEVVKPVKAEKSEASEKKKIDEAYYFNLKPEANDVDGVQNKIIFGRKHIMMVKVENGNQQALVVWKLLRTDAKALTIDMTQMTIKLISCEKSVLKELNFESSEDCLKFANTFYERMQNKVYEDNRVDEDLKDKVPKAVIDAADDDGDTEFAAVRLERLNDEEQAVLDTYRRLRRSKPPKDALAESVSKESSLDESHKSLDEGDEKIASKYRKMLKLRIPVEAVEHGMKKDGVAQHIIEAVLGKSTGVPDNVDAADLPATPVSTFSSASTLSDSDAATVEKYKKMIKMGIPEDAVRHKLLNDGVDTKFHEFIFDNNSQKDSSKPVPSLPSLSPADEAVAAHYRKLISRGVPKDSVRWGMTKDKVKPHIIVAVVGETQEPDHSGTGQPHVKNTKNSLTAEEEKIVTQFKKLLKRQIPRQQILERMKREGVSENVIIAVLGKGSIPSSEKEDAPKGKGSQFVQIHWTPLSGSQLDNSVFAKNRSFEFATPEGTAFSKLKELFEKKKNNHVPKNKSMSQSKSTSTKANLLDINRSNNIAISLKAFKEYSFAELSEIIRFLDPLKKLHGERVHFLRDLLPTISETNIVKSFDGPESMLDPAERWFKSIVNIKRIESKVNVLRTMEMLEVEARSIGENLRLLTKVCNQVINSDRLQDLLVVVLQIGNIMNEGTRTGGAAGFKMDSLLKLTQTKSADGKTTVLDYLVEDLYLAKGERHKLDLLSDFPECSTASRMLIGDLVAEVKAMQDSVAECKKELEALRKESLGKNTGVSSAIAKIESQDKNSIHGAIARLEEFSVMAEEIVASLSNEKDEALKASTDLCLYCGEGSGSTAATSLLGILSEFATNIQSAVRKSDDKRKRSEKRQRRQADDSESSKASEMDLVEEANGGSLVLLVNQMLKDANPRTIEDFRKGRVLDNPSKLMKTIYVKEKMVDVESLDTPRASLADAIQEKTETFNDGDIVNARTKFGSPNHGRELAEKNGESDRMFNQARSPPVPWAPPLRERSSSGMPRPASSSEGKDDAAATPEPDFFADAPSALSGKPRLDRPTPEVVPLRSRADSGNTALNRNLVPPSPEMLTRDKLVSEKLTSQSTNSASGEQVVPTSVPSNTIDLQSSVIESPTLENDTNPAETPTTEDSVTVQDSLLQQSSGDSQDSSVVRSGRVSAMAAVFSKTQAEPLIPSQSPITTNLVERQGSSTDNITSIPKDTTPAVNQATSCDSTENETPTLVPVDSDAENRPDPPSINTENSSKPDPPHPATDNNQSITTPTPSPPQEALSIKSVDNDSKVHNSFKDFFNVTAARKRIAARKSIEPAVSTNGASQSKLSLQEKAALKRDRRSIERSPVKPQAQSATPPSDCEPKIPTVAGYLELARQRRSSNQHRKSIESKANGNSQPTTNNAERESTFARMARERRATRKNDM
jgi:hypothetical protein